VWLRQPSADAGLNASSRTAHIPRIRSDTAFHPLEAAVWLDRTARISRIPSESGDCGMPERQGRSCPRPARARYHALDGQPLHEPSQGVST
jgi:hypothetical protein